MAAVASSSALRCHRGQLAAAALASPRPCQRSYKSWIRVGTSNGHGSARVNLNTSIYGLATSRGTRPYQEDTSSISCLSIPPSELRASLKKSSNRISQEAARRWTWDTQDQPLDEELASQVFWFGVFDGHGGSYTSRYLATYLHQIYERVTPDMVTDTVQATREHGGYFRRFIGGALDKWVVKDELKPVRGGKGNQRYAGKQEQDAGESSADDVGPSAPPTGTHAAKSSGSNGSPSSSSPHTWDDDGLTRRIPPPESMSSETLTLSERATLAFLVADRHILAGHPQPSGSLPSSSMHDPASAPTSSGRRRGIQTREMEEEQRESDKGVGKAGGGGSTGTVLALHSLDGPPKIWYDSSLLQLCAYHVGDTRLLLVPTSDGQAIPLTTNHHPDTPTESDRLRRLGAGVITDSFGESRWMGALANTRALGDGNFKSFGVTAEPEIVSQVVKSDMYACAVIFSDGITEVMSDQEAVDLVRGAKHPNDAAKRILAFAEELGVEDNATVIVAPLKGWGAIGGSDTTLKQREYRKSKVDVFRDHRQ